MPLSFLFRDQKQQLEDAYRSGYQQARKDCEMLFSFLHRREFQSSYESFFAKAKLSSFSDLAKGLEKSLKALQQTQRELEKQQWKIQELQREVDWKKRLLDQVNAGELLLQIGDLERDCDRLRVAAEDAEQQLRWSLERHDQEIADLHQDYRQQLDELDERASRFAHLVIQDNNGMEQG